MSFNTAAGRAEYVIGAGQNDYTFVFKIYDTTDLVVSVSDSNAGAFVELIPTEYSIVINGDNGGTVSINVPLVTGGVVLLTRELPVIRTIEYSHGGDIAAATLNEDQDYQTYLLLDSSYKSMSNRIYHNKRGYENVSTEMPIPDAGKVIAWNSLGNSLENVTLGTGSNTNIRIERVAAGGETSINIAPHKDDAMLYINGVLQSDYSISNSIIILEKALEPLDEYTLIIAPDASNIGANGTFTTADGKTVTVFFGLITSIA